MSMLTVKNKAGREMELSVYGKYSDDIQVDEALYVDNGEEATDEDVEYAMHKYADKVYQTWFESQISSIDFMD